jgi:lysophospholipase L1-like esterase
LYAFGSWYYYERFFDETRFTAYHSFLQVKPPVWTVAVPKPDNVFRILCLGGSTTAGEQLAQSYPDLLGQMLSERYRGKRIEVVNGGTFFYTTQHSIIEYLFTMKELSPDVILFFEAINDVCASFTRPPFAAEPFRADYGHYMGFAGSLRYPVTYEKFLSRFFFCDMRMPALQAVARSDFKSLHSFKRNLCSLIKIARAHNIVLILANQPHCFSRSGDSDVDFLGFPKFFLVTKDQYADEKSWYNAMELFNSATENIAKTFSVPFVDQQQKFLGRRDLFTDAVHTTTEGNRLRAQLFTDTIVELGLISATEEPSQ